MSDLKTEDNLAQPPGALLPEFRARLFYNAVSGAAEDDPQLLAQILTELQAWRILTEVTVVRPELDLGEEARRAVSQGTELVLVCGGDGTIDSVMAGLVGSEATLGILPGGTQNNVARSLNIPLGDVPAAVALLRQGKRIKIDVGEAHCEGETRQFLEMCTIGLLSDLFEAADELQKGKLSRIGDLLATLVGAEPAAIQVDLDEGVRRLTTEGHIVLIANLPYFGAQIQLVPDISFEDGLLDVVVFSELDKPGLLRVAAQALGGAPEDERIRHYKVASVRVHTQPKMSANADGFELCSGDVEARVLPASLWVMAGPGPETGEATSA